MKTATLQHLNQDVKIALKAKQAKLYPSLDVETRTTLPTDAAAYHLNRQQQTLRAWACFESAPIRPVRINGRLAWKVADIRALLNGGAK